jgi:hypothetical protein
LIGETNHSWLDTRVNGYPVLLDFRKRVVYSSYTSILTIAGQHDWDDNGVVGLADDVGDVFDLENEDLDDTFNVRAANGNDKILVIDEL